MAKSVRSKWRRKMRNAKREKYSKKENERLLRIKEMALKNDAAMAELCTVKKAEEIKKQAAVQDKPGTSMEVDAKAKTHDPVTLRDEHGHYPAWMNQRAVKKHKKQLKHNGKKKATRW